LIDHGTLHDDAHFAVEDACGVTGFTTQVYITFDGRWTLASRGTTGRPISWSLDASPTCFTNVATGHRVRLQQAARGNDIRVSDNGDGTMT
jgi:hypothetical protein